MLRVRMIDFVGFLISNVRAVPEVREVLRVLGRDGWGKVSVSMGGRDGSWMLYRDTRREATGDGYWEMFSKMVKLNEIY